jgi:hypothetical protein
MPLPKINEAFAAPEPSDRIRHAHAQKHHDAHKRMRTHASAPANAVSLREANRLDSLRMRVHVGAPTAVSVCARVTVRTRASVRACVRTWVRKHPRVRVLITCACVHQHSVAGWSFESGWKSVEGPGTAGQRQRRVF